MRTAKPIECRIIEAEYQFRRSCDQICIILINQTLISLSHRYRKAKKANMKSFRYQLRTQNVGEKKKKERNKMSVWTDHDLTFTDSFENRDGPGRGLLISSSESALSMNFFSFQFGAVVVHVTYPLHGSQPQ